MSVQEIYILLIEERNIEHLKKKTNKKFFKLQPFHHRNFQFPLSTFHNWRPLIHNVFKPSFILGKNMFKVSDLHKDASIPRRTMKNYSYSISLLFSISWLIWCWRRPANASFEPKKIIFILSDQIILRHISLEISSWIESILVVICLLFRRGSILDVSHLNLPYDASF